MIVMFLHIFNFSIMKTVYQLYIDIVNLMRQDQCKWFYLYPLLASIKIIYYYYILHYDEELYIRVFIIYVFFFFFSLQKYFLKISN
jgi:hypothetical protein